MQVQEFENLDALHALWLVPVLVVVLLYGHTRRRRALERFAAPELLERLAPGQDALRRGVKAVLLLLAPVFMVGALVGPKWGEYYEDVKRKGIDIMVALDVSRSMLARDVAPNRLERAKQDIRDLVRILPGDRVGLVTFAGTATLACPLTTDYGFFRLALEDAGTHSTPRGGSLIGDAVRKCVSCFDDRIQKYKAIILITDGEDHESEPVRAARDAYEQHGVRVYTVGIGDSGDGARIPTTEGGTETYLRYEDQEVWSRMDPVVLSKMADAGNGAYVPAGTANIELDKIYDQYIAAQEKREFEETHLKRYRVQFQWFVGAALLCLAAESLLSPCRPLKAIRDDEVRIYARSLAEVR
jgi:Ca-activated chloride channel family protein